MIDISAGSLYKVINCLFIHIRRALAGKLLTILACGIRGYDTGTVKAVKAYDLDILELDNISRLYNLAAILGNAPAYPGINRLLRSDEGNRDLLAVLVGGGHAGIDNMSCPLC